MTPSPLRSSDPRQLGAYRLLGLLGEGGMGSVYLGESPAGQRVAVKVIRPELSCDPGFRARFRSEVKRARQVPPFCTAEVLDADADHATPYLVVEYVDGPSLADLVDDRGPLSGAGLHSVAIGVATALVAIHDVGVVHRDLKPANVLLPFGTPRVIDFGIARALDTSSQHTLPGQIFGTVSYMGPERFDAKTAGNAEPSTDVFAWGAVVAFAGTGHTPFAPESLIATASGAPLPAPELAGLPQPLHDLVARALHEDPHERPTAHELLELLIKVGAAGDSVVRAGFEHRPDLKRAAAAVRHTVRYDGRTDDTSRMPAHSRPTALVPARPRTTRRMPPSAVAAVTVLALATGLTIYPLAQRLLASNTTTQATPADPLRERSGHANGAASRGGSPGSCTLDGPLEVTPRTPKAFTCPVSRIPTNQSILATAKLATPDACAAIWIHLGDDDGYRITVCADHVSLGVGSNSQARTISYTVLEPPFEPGTWHEIEVATRASGITVNIDHEQAVSQNQAALQPPHGTVTLGLAPEPNLTTGSTVTQVTFTNVTVTSSP